MPAIEYPVPWSGLVRTCGRFIEMLTALSNSSVLRGASAWSWYMAATASNSPAPHSGENRVGRKGARQIRVFFAKPVQNRVYDVDFLPSHKTVLARMRIQPAYGRFSASPRRGACARAPPPDSTALDMRPKSRSDGTFESGSCHVASDTKSSPPQST